MSDVSPRESTGDRIARWLPRRVREEVFDPAYCDFLVHEARSGPPARWRRSVVAFLIAVDAFRVGLPSLLVRGGRLTVLGRCGALVAAGMSLVVVAWNLTHH